MRVAISRFCCRLNAEGRSPHTVGAYRRDLLCLAGALEKRHPEIAPGKVTAPMLDRALTSRQVTESATGGRRSVASMHRFRAAVRAFFNWAEQSGIIAANPAATLTLHRLPRKLPQYLSEAEKRKLLKALRSGSSTEASRDRAIFELFLGTGIRLQELVSLDVEDIDLAARQLRVRAKGGSQQVKFLKSNLRSLLRAYLKQRRKADVGRYRALFLSNRGSRLSQRQVARRLEHWLGMAGIAKKLSPHALRHTFATHLYSRTGDILVVQRALGHRDLSTTLIYTHLVDSQLENAIERL